jgi:Tol biopolymer transport system component
VVQSIDTQDLEQDPSLTADGLSIFFTTGSMGKNKCVGGNFCIAQAFRGSPVAGFTDAGFVVNNAGANQRTPYVVGNGPTVYYALSSASTADFDITSTSGSGTLVNVNSPFAETSPVVTPDELTLYFASNRGSDGGTESDIWVATRKKKTDAFDPPTRVDALSSASDESPGFISSDGCRMYMTRDDGAVGGPNLYFASKGK